jgi:hypothetical protein
MGGGISSTSVKNTHPVTILATGIIILALLCAPALALTKEDILSKYNSSSGSTAIQSLIDQIIAPAAPVDDGMWYTPTNEYPDCPPGEVCIGERIEFIEIEPSGSEGRFICPPDRPVGQLHHCFCMCLEYVNVETGEKFNSECVNPETGHPYPMGIDDLGRTFIVKEDCPCTWADDDRVPDSPTYHDIPIPPGSGYSYDYSLFASRIQSILYPDITYPTTPTFDSTSRR